MPSGVVPHYQPCLLVCCITIGHAFWYGASLSAKPSIMVPHYRPCFLVWCLIISHFCWCGDHYRRYLLVWNLIIRNACWCGSSLQTMPVGVVPHYRPCLLVNRHCNRHFTSRRRRMVASLVLLFRGAITSDMFADPVPLSDMPACAVQLYQTCMLGSFIQIRMFVKCCSTRQGIWSVTNPSGRVPSQRFVNLVGYHPGSHLEYIKF